MRAVALIACMLVAALAFGQGFNKRHDAFANGFAQTGFGVELLPDGFMIISGSDDYDSIAPGTSFFHGSVLLTKIDPSGNTIWEKRSWRPFHSAFAGWSNCCDTIPGGGYVVGGASEDTTGFDEVYLMRFDANGDTLWTRVFGDPNGNSFWIGYQVKRTTDGGFLIMGFTGPEGLMTYSAFAIKTDEQGVEQWRSTYLLPGDLYGSFLCSDLAANGDLFMAGGRWQVISNGDRWVQRTDSLGNTRWSVGWGSAYTDGSVHIQTMADGHVLVASGHAFAAGGDAMRPYLAKLDSTDGSIIWERDFGPTAPNTLFFTSKECPGGDLIAAGVTYAGMGISANNVQKGLLCRTTSAGDSLWMFAYYSVADSLTDGTGRFYDVLPTADGGFIAAGAAYFSASGNNPPGISQDTWVVKVDSMGCVVPGCNSVGITEQATNLLDAISIFPNPASGQATVQLSLPPSVGNGPLQLSLVAMDGRVVMQEALPNGVSAFSFPVSGFASGVYYVHVANEGKWLTGGKLIVE